MPPKCSRCGFFFAGDICPKCGHNRRPKSARLIFQICPNCRWSTKVDEKYICRRFPPTIMRAGRWDYPEVDERTPNCAEWVEK